MRDLMRLQIVDDSATAADGNNGRDRAAVFCQHGHLLLLRLRLPGHKAILAASASSSSRVKGGKLFQGVGGGRRARGGAGAVTRSTTTTSIGQILQQIRSGRQRLLLPLLFTACRTGEDTLPSADDVIRVEDVVIEDDTGPLLEVFLLPSKMSLWRQSVAISVVYRPSSRVRFEKLDVGDGRVDHLRLLQANLVLTRLVTK